jgi:hypothetical protein
VPPSPEERVRRRGCDVRGVLGVHLLLLEVEFVLDVRVRNGRRLQVQGAEAGIGDAQADMRAVFVLAPGIGDRNFADFFEETLLLQALGDCVARCGWEFRRHGRQAVVVIAGLAEQDQRGVG